MAGFWDTMLGGMNASTNPSDYKTPYQDRGQILGQINQGFNDVRGRQAPTIDPAFRNAQLAQMGQLQGIASGQQQGAGELAVQRQGQNALAAQQAMAHMARGGNAGMAMLGAQRNAAGIGVNTAGQAQQAAMGDQMNAQGLLAGITNSGRSGDLGVAGMQQQQMGMNDQATLAYLSQLTGMDQGQLAAQMQAMQAANSKQGLAGGLLQLGGTLGGAAIMSDESVKDDIIDGSDSVDEMLSKLHAKKYRYKDSKHGDGMRVGVMA